MKYWLNGASVIIPEDNGDSGGMKYWLSGEPFVIMGNNIGAQISVADKTWSTIKKIAGIVIAAIKKIGGVSP